VQCPNGLDDARRIEKIIACSVPPATHVIAEYDGNNNLLRKYIYGPGTKQIRNPKPATRDNIKFKFPSVKNRQS